MSQSTTSESQTSSTLIDQPASAVDREIHATSLVASRYEKVSSLLLAASMFTGILVALLFLLWVTSGRSELILPLPPIAEPKPPGGGNLDGAELRFEPPGVEEVESLLEPTIENRLQAVTDAASAVSASFEAIDSDKLASSAGSGPGDRRPPGPPGGDEDIVPRHERWKLKFVAKDAMQYARQLDFFGIELGAIGGAIQGVDYASELASGPKARQGEAGDESRLYFIWTTSGPLMQYDRQFLQEAGIDLSGRQMLKFIPANTENILASIELEYAKANGHQSVMEIAQTVFESRPTEGVYRFEVIEQKYRKFKK